MKLFLMLLVFAAAVFLGIYAAAFGALENVLFTMPPIERYVIDPADRRVEVKYLGLYSEAQDIGTVSLIFSIRNGTSQPQTYVGWTRDRSFPVFKVDDVALPGPYFCSRGTSRYTIPPGGSAKVLVSREDFPADMSYNRSVAVGFKLRPDADTSSVVYFSDRLALPEGFILDRTPDETAAGVDDRQQLAKPSTTARPRH